MTPELARAITRARQGVAVAPRADGEPTRQALRAQLRESVWLEAREITRKRLIDSRTRHGVTPPPDRRARRADARGVVRRLWDRAGEATP